MNMYSCFMEIVFSPPPRPVLNIDKICDNIFPKNKIYIKLLFYDLITKVLIIFSKSHVFPEITNVA